MAARVRAGKEAMAGRTQASVSSDLIRRAEASAGKGVHNRDSSIQKTRKDAARPSGESRKAKMSRIFKCGASAAPETRMSAPAIGGRTKIARCEKSCKKGVATKAAVTAILSRRLAASSDALSALSRLIIGLETRSRKLWLWGQISY